MSSTYPPRVTGENPSRNSDYWDREWETRTRVTARTEATTYLISLATMRECNTIIDIGCGKTDILEVIRGVTQAKRCIGVDYSETALEANREYNWGEWLQCDIEHERVGLPDETGDFVYSSHVIEHVFDPYVLLDEQMRLCKKGGIVALVVPLKMHHWEHRHVFDMDAVVGMLGCYAKPVFVYSDMRQSEVVVGVIKP